LKPCKIEKFLRRKKLCSKKKEHKQGEGRSTVNAEVVFQHVTGFEGKRKKKHVREKKRKEKKNCVFACPCVELLPFMLSNTVYQRIELTKQIDPQSMYVSRALCIIVLWSQGSD